MQKYISLVFINLLSLFQRTNRRKNIKSKNKTSFSAFPFIVVLIGMTLFFSIYSFSFAAIMAQAQLLFVLPVVLAVFSSIISLFFTTFAASNMIFKGKDISFMLSLPITSFTVFGVKLTALYFENLIFCLSGMLSSGIAYLCFGGRGGVYFMVMNLLCVPFISLIPTFFGLIIGYCLVLLQSSVKKNVLLDNLFYFILLAVWFLISFSFNYIIQFLITNVDGFLQVFHTWLFPFDLYMRCIFGSFSSFLLLIMITVIPCLLLAYMMSIKYIKIVTKLNTQTVKGKYHLKELKSHGRYFALLKKESQRFFGTPLYLFNSGMGIFMAIGLSIFLCFERESSHMFMNLFGETSMLLLVGGIMMTVLSLINPASVSISLEGEYLWLVKSIPVSFQHILLMKAFFNMLLIWGTGLISLPMIAYSFSFSPICIFLLFLFMASIGWTVPLFGVYINLKFPKLDAKNEVSVIKQSRSASICILLPMLLVVVIGALYYGLTRFVFIGDIWNIAFLAAVCVLFFVLGLLLLRNIIKYGEEKFLALS